MPDLTITIKGVNLSQSAFDKLKRDLGETSQAVERIASTQKDFNASLLQVASSIGVMTAGLGLFLRDSVRTAVAFESMKRSLTAVEGGAERASKALTTLREVAKLPGLNLQQAIQGYTNLRAIGMESTLATRALMAFGNALVTVGKGASSLQLVILALTQMSAKGKVLGQDLRQLQEQLPQVRDAMRKAFGTADVEELQKHMEKTGKTADDFIRAVVEQFEKLPKVTSGAQNAIENFQDAMMQLKVAFGENFVPTLTKVLNTLSSLMESFNKLPSRVRGLITEFAFLGAGLGAITTAGFGLYKLLSISLIPVLVSLKASLVSLGAILATNPYTIWVVGLGALIGALLVFKQHLGRHVLDVEQMRKAWNEMSAVQKSENILKLAKEYDALSNKTSLTVDESQRLVSVQNELAKLAPNLVSGFDQQGNAIIKTGKAFKEYIELVKSSNAEVRKNFLAIVTANEERLNREQQKLETLRGRLESAMLSTGELWRKRGLDEAKVGEKLVPYSKRLEETNQKLAKVREEMGKIAEFRKEVFGEGVEEIPKTPAPFPEYSKEAQAIYREIARERLETIQDEFQRKKALADFDLETARKKFVLETSGIEKTSAKYQELYAELLLAEEKHRSAVINLERERNEKIRKERQKTLYEIKTYELELEDLSERERARRRVQLEYSYNLAIIEKSDPLYKEKVEALYKKRDAELVKIERGETEELRNIQREIAQERIRALTLPESVKEEMLAKLTLAWAKEDFERASKDDKIAIAKWEQAQAQYNQRILNIRRKRAEELRRASQEYERAILESEGVGGIERLQRERQLLLGEIERAKVTASPEEILRMQTQLLRINTEIKNAYKAQADAIREAERKLAEETLRLTETDKGRLQVVLLELRLKQALVDIDERVREKDITPKEADLRRQTAHLEYLNEVRQINEEIANTFAEIESRLETPEDFENYWKLVERGYSPKRILELMQRSKEEFQKREYIPDLLMGTEEFNRIRSEVDRMYRDAWEKKRDFLKSFVIDFVRLPYDLMTIAWESRALTKDFERDLERINRERVKSIEEVRSRETMSYAEKARAIERIERESAERRREIERELAERKKALWLDYAKDFMSNIFRRIVENVEENIADRITAYMLSQMRIPKQLPMGGQTEASGSGLWRLLASLVQVGVGVGTGNPALVASGATTMGMYAVEVPEPLFDNAYNDYMAFQLGQRRASYVLGAKSISDMLQNYTEGIASGVSRAEAVFPERIILEVDGRELYGVIKRRDDKTSSRKFAY